MDDRGTKLELQDEDWVTLNFKRGWRSKKSFAAQAAFDLDRRRAPAPASRQRAEPC